METSHLDHLVLTVRDVKRTVEFYEQALGMKKIIFSGDRVAMSFGNQKINLHECGNEFEPKAFEPKPGSADLCFIIQTPINEAKDYFESLGLEIIEGPVSRAGAIGPMTSLYVRDPDKNLIEVANYGP